MTKVGLAAVMAVTVLSASDYSFVRPLWSTNTVINSTSFQTTRHGVVVEADHGSAEYSVKCLECHDGINAKNAFITRPMDAGAQSVALRAMAGDSKRHHPVNVVYLEGKAGLKPLHSTLKGVWKGNVTTIADILVNGRVECSTCHLDPHVIDPDTQTLRNANAKSVLCMSCHNQ